MSDYKTGDLYAVVTDSGHGSAECGRNLEPTPPADAEGAIEREIGRGKRVTGTRIWRVTTTQELV